MEESGTKPLDNGDVFKSPNNQYTVAVSTNRFGVSLTIKKIDNGGQGESTFPMAQIIADVPVADGVLPALEADNATFAYDFYFGEALFRRARQEEKGRRTHQEVACSRKRTQKTTSKSKERETCRKT